MRHVAERTDFRAKTLLFTLMAIGLLIPGFARCHGLAVLLHPRIGLVNQFLVTDARPQRSAVQHQSLSAWAGCKASTSRRRLHHDGGCVPSMDPTLEEAAEMHGAGPWRVIRRITVRLAWARYPRRLDLHLHDCVRGLRCARHHRLGHRIFTFTTYLYLLLNPQDVLPKIRARGRALRPSRWRSRP